MESLKSNTVIPGSNLPRIMNHERRSSSPEVSVFPHRGSLVLIEIMQVMLSMLSIAVCIFSLVEAKSITEDCYFSFTATNKGDVRSIAVVNCVEDPDMIWTLIGQGIWCAMIILIISSIRMRLICLYQSHKIFLITFTHSITILFASLLVGIEYLALTREKYFSYKEFLTEDGRVEGRNVFHLQEVFYIFHSIMISVGGLAIVLSLCAIVLLELSIHEIKKEKDDFNLDTEDPYVIPAATQATIHPPPLAAVSNPNSSQPPVRNNNTQMFRNPAFVPTRLSGSSPDFPRPPSFLQVENESGRRQNQSSRRQVSFGDGNKFFY